DEPGPACHQTKFRHDLYPASGRTAGVSRLVRQQPADSTPYQPTACRTSRLTPAVRQFRSADGGEGKRAAVTGEDGASQRRVLRSREGRVLRDQGEGVLAGQVQQGGVSRQIGETQVADTVLPRPEELAQAAQPGVLLGEREAVGGAGEDA